MCDLDDIIDPCIKFVQPITMAVLFIIGIPLFVIGGKRRFMDIWPSLSSLPLFSGDAFPFDKYYITQKKDSTFLNSLDISIPINNKAIKNKDIYLIHNMWGFDLNLTLIVNNENLQTFQKKQNLNFSFPDVRFYRNPIQKMPKIGSSLKKRHIAENTFNVFCPYPTEITYINNIQSYCESKAFPMKFEGSYSNLKIFDSFKSNSFSEITIKFDRSYFISYNYNNPPEAYILFCGGKTTESMYLAGLSFIIIGVILFVLFLVFDFILVFLI